MPAAGPSLCPSKHRRPPELPPDGVPPLIENPSHAVLNRTRRAKGNQAQVKKLGPHSCVKKVSGTSNRKSITSKLANGRFELQLGDDYAEGMETADVSNDVDLDSRSEPELAVVSPPFSNIHHFVDLEPLVEDYQEPSSDDKDPGKKKLVLTRVDAPSVSSEMSFGELLVMIYICIV
ncbi:hypothetical protein L1887_07352 [Cichorium endivia]|nr:hypothetical protein L1887_07352 [Cichorium endivia]